MKKEDLQQRIIAINMELMQTKDAIRKLEGHLAEANHWLATMHKDEMEALEKAKQEPKEQENGEAIQQAEEQTA